MSSAPVVVEQLAKLFSIAQCREGHKSVLKPLVASCIKSDSRESRLKVFLQHLDYTVIPSYPGEYDGGEIILDLMQQAAAFAIEQGFPIHQICFFLSFYISSLQSVEKLCNKGEPSLVEVIQQLQNEIIPLYSIHLPSHTLLIAVNFVTKSILQHLHLYHFLLTEPQPTDLTTVELEIDTPPNNIVNLQDGMEEGAWQKMQAEQELKLAHEAKVKIFEEHQLRAIQEAEEKLSQTCESLLSSFSEGPVKMTLEKVACIVSELTKAHMHTSLVAIKQNFLRQTIDLDYRLDQLEAMVAVQQNVSRRHTEQQATLSSKRAESRSGVRRNT